MLTKMAIRNYQSLHEVDIELAPFVVIVGQTSSGKSAFTRALRTFVANTRGTAFISHGEQSTVLQGTTDDGTVITLTRGRTSAHDAYLVTKPGQYGAIEGGAVHANGQQERFTKLGGKTPPEVSAAIGIDPDDPLTFASQFDRPYLLSDSPAEVARTFGALTNVAVIMAASRESKRLKTTAAQTLKTRTEDAEQLRADTGRIRSVIQQSNHLRFAETALQRAQSIEEKQQRIEALLADINTDATVTIESPLPSLENLEQRAARLGRLRTLVLALRDAGRDARQAHDARVEAINTVGAMEAEYTQALIDAHECPVCGQSTEHLHT